jgi:hypothetical protein
MNEEACITCWFLSAQNLVIPVYTFAVSEYYLLKNWRVTQ